MEQVTHPAHYNLDGRKECWDEMEEQFGRLPTIMFCLLSAYKYIYRAGNKGDAEKDLEKAEVFINHAYEINKGWLDKEMIKDNCRVISKLYYMLSEARNKED